MFIHIYKYISMGNPPPRPRWCSARGPNGPGGPGALRGGSSVSGTVETFNSKDNIMLPRIITIGVTL